MKSYSIPVVTLLQDCGDDGYTMHAYNSEEELLADHQLAVNGAVTPEQRDKILQEDDPYNNGYIGADTINVVVDDSGVIRLAKKISFHAGQ